MRILVLILLLFPLLLTANDLSGIDVAYYDFDPRIIAMGGASVAVQGTSPASIIANPAALAGQNEQYLFQVSNSTYLDLINYNYAGVSWQQQPGQILSLAMDFSGDEALSEYEMILSYSRILSKFNCENVDAMVEEINKVKPNMLKVAEIVGAGVKGLHLAIIKANIEDKKRIRL
jgi:hypothetical protein